MLTFWTKLLTKVKNRLKSVKLETESAISISKEYRKQQLSTYDIYFQFVRHWALQDCLQ